MRNLFALSVAFLWMATATFAQVGINSDNSAPDPSAMLDVKSTSKGFLPPRMATAQRDLINRYQYHTWIFFFCAVYGRRLAPGPLY